MTFPLPLTAFEAYMWADDSPGHPMTALYEVACTGTIDRDRFERAVDLALQQHPLLRSVVDPTTRRPTWKPVAAATPFLSWEDDGDPLRYPGDNEYVDLTREIGVRIWVRSRSDGARVLFQVHHACADGLGVTNFALDVFCAYAHLSAPANVPAPQRDALLLTTRDRFYRRPLFGSAKMLIWAAMHMVTWIGSRPISLATRDRAAPPQQPMDTIRDHVLDRHETDQLIAAAHAANVTVNDLLLRDLFLTLAERSADEPSTVDGCHCVCMPMSLRNRDDAQLPATNKMTMTFLRRTSQACRDRVELLRGLRQETLHAKRTRRGLRMIEVLRLALALRGRVPQGLLAKSSFASAVLSNLGRIDRSGHGLPVDDEGRLVAGEVTIDRIVTAPNGRPGTAVVIVVHTYAGQLTISLRFDPTAFTADDADRLLDDYARQLRTTASEVEPALAAV